MKDLGGILPFLLIIVVFWFLILRPQRRRQRELAATQGALAIGSEVMLTSGIYGTVASLDEETIRLELSPGTTIKVARQAVVRVVEDSTTHGFTQVEGDTETDTDPRP
ncbi:MAG: preprotein translocase subunit YajC [Nocardioidaceae bacterium]